MYEALIIAIATVASVFTGLILFMMLARIVGGIYDTWAARRRAVLEPLLVRDIAVEGRSAEEVLTRVLRSTDRRLLRELLLEEVQVVRGVAQERLCAVLDSFGFVDEWIEGLRSRRWWRRAECAENLGIARAARAVDRLVAHLEDGVPEVRLRAARALGAVRGSSAVRPLVFALSRPDRWSTIRVADILAGAGRDAVEELIDAWDDLNQPARLAALDILGQVRELSSVPFVQRRLEQSESPDIRARAAHALGSMGDPESRNALVRALGDTHWPVRAMAAKALGRTGRRDAVHALAETLADKSWWVRANAAEALRALGDAGIRALTDTLDSSDLYARHQAVMVLQAAGVVDRMAETYATGTGPEQERAGGFLRRILDEGHRELLESIAENHPVDPVRRAIARLVMVSNGAGGAP